MKRTILMLCLATGLISSAMTTIAAPRPATPPPAVANFLIQNHIHVYFHSKAKAEAFAAKHGIDKSNIAVYVLKSASSDEKAQEIYVINKILSN